MKHNIYQIYDFILKHIIQRRYDIYKNILIDTFYNTIFTSVPNKSNHKAIELLDSTNIYIYIILQSN